jgi:hypothetical protein
MYFLIVHDFLTIADDDAAIVLVDLLTLQVVDDSVLRRLGSGLDSVDACRLVWCCRLYTA